MDTKKLEQIVRKYFKENNIDEVQTTELKKEIEAAGVFPNVRDVDVALRDRLRKYFKSGKEQEVPYVLSKDGKDRWFFKNIWMNKEIKYWAAAFYWGDKADINKYDEFLREGWWGTDHPTTSKKGREVHRLIAQMQLGDKIILRKVDRKRQTIRVLALGTITNNSNIADGYVSVNWELKGNLHFGKLPSGANAGNWWGTLLEVTRKVEIKNLFIGLKPIQTSYRVCRLTWNSYGWVKPSGPIGKSSNSKTHEGGNRYGHEEWLLDLDKLIDGFHYGFLEPVNKYLDTYTGNTYDIGLYTIDAVSKQAFWIGEIKNVEVIDKEISGMIVKEYERNGWLTEMREQLETIDANAANLNKWIDELFNVRFLPSDVHLLDPPLPIKNLEESIGAYRYTLISPKAKIELDNPEKDSFEFTAQKPGEAKNYTSVYSRKTKSVELTHKHKELSTSLYNHLIEKFGANNVAAELNSGLGTRIDMAHKDPKTGALTFYEIKTYNSIKDSIREAIGQLLEYSYWPDKVKADELVIVTHLPGDENVGKYMQQIRQKFKLPLYYCHFVNGELSKKI